MKTIQPLRTAAVFSASALLAACSSSGSSTAAHSTSQPGQSPAVSSPAAASTTSAAAIGGTNANTWCGELAAAGRSALSGGTPTKPIAAATLHRLIDDAPAAIRADVQRLGAVALAAEQHKINQPPSDSRYLQAGEHVAVWMQANCPTVFQTLNPGYPSP
jgi:hypothetical protein